MVIVFDVMGTLLNPAPVAPLVKRASRGRMNVKQFFDEVTTYAMANTLSGEQPSFESVAAAVLQMTAAAHGQETDAEDLAKLRKRLGGMPPFADVKPSLERMHDRGLRLAVLSNANTELLQEQMKRSKLAKYFEQVISAEAARRFKPAKEVYELALERLGGNPHEMLMVAAHPWDLLGAARVGCRTALIDRTGKAAYPGVPEPNHVAKDIDEFADQLLGVTTEKKSSSSGWLLAGAGVALGLGVASTKGLGISRRIQ